MTVNHGRLRALDHHNPPFKDVMVQVVGNPAKVPPVATKQNIPFPSFTLETSQTHKCRTPRRFHITRTEKGIDGQRADKNHFLGPGFVDADRCSFSPLREFTAFDPRRRHYSEAELVHSIFRPFTPMRHKAVRTQGAV